MGTWELRDGKRDGHSRDRNFVLWWGEYHILFRHYTYLDSSSLLFFYSTLISYLSISEDKIILSKLRWRGRACAGRIRAAREHGLATDGMDGLGKEGGTSRKNSRPKLCWLVVLRCWSGL